MKLFIFLAIIFSSSIVSCGTKTDSSSISDVRDASVTTLETSKDPETGAETASVKSDGTAQEIKVSDSNTTLTGTKVAFPANALASNTQIKIEEGASIASETTASLTNNVVKSTGTPIAIQSSIAQDATVPFSVQVGLPADFALTSATDKYSNLIIIYKVKIVAEDKVIVGILPRNAITIEGSSAKFLIKYFGVYQTAIMENEVTTASEIAATKPIETKREETATAVAAAVSTPTPTPVATVAATPVVTAVAAVAVAATPTPTVAATPTPTPMYIAGTSSNQAGYLKGDVWTAFTVPSGTTSSTVYTFNVSGSDVSATGQIVNTGTTKLGYWTSDLAWHESVSLSASTITISGNQVAEYVYAGSYISSTNAYKVGLRMTGNSVGTVAGYLKNGIGWTDLPALVSTKYSRALSIFVNGSDVYIGGGSADNTNFLIAGYWLNGTFHSQSNTGIYSNVRYITMNGSDIYTAGYTDTANGPGAVYQAGYWKNDNGFQSLPVLDTSKAPSVTSMVFNGSDIYILGTNRNASNIPVAGYWLNHSGQISWNALPVTDITSTGNAATSLTINGSDLYFIGVNNSVNGYWKNGTWTATTITPNVIVIQ